MKSKVFKALGVVASAIVIAVSIFVWFDYTVHINTSGGFVSISLEPNNVYASSTLTLRPNGAGTYTQCTPDSGSNYARVNGSTEGPGYVYASANGKIDTYAMANHSSQLGSIISVTVYANCKKTGTGSSTIAQRLRLGTTNVDDASYPALTTSYVLYSAVLGRPGGGSWSWTDIDNLEAGITLYCTPGTSVTYCDWLYIIVTYNAPTFTITNSSSSFGFGTVNSNSTYYSGGGAYSNPVTDAQCYFTVTNGDSNNPVQIEINETNPTGGVGWTLSSSVGTDIIKDIAVVSGVDPASGVVLMTSNQSLIASLAASGTKKWDLERQTGTFSDSVTKTSTLTLTGVSP
jgi:hypothetical protein